MCELSVWEFGPPLAGSDVNNLWHYLTRLWNEALFKKPNLMVC